mgnify:CR=1 FL=1
MKYSIILKIVIILCMLVSWAAADTMSKKLSQYVHRSWKAENGLPQNTLTSITQTTDGYLWLGSRAGLIRFDGVEFSSFNKKTYPAMLDDDIWTLAADPDSGLWAGTAQGGLLYLYGNRMKRYTIENGLSENGIWSLYFDQEGTLWIGTSGGGLNYLKEGVFSHYTTDDGLSSDYIWATLKDSRGTLWIGTDGDGLNAIHQGKTTKFNESNGFSADYVFSIIEDDTGVVWFGTEAGLFSWKNNQFKQYTAADGLSGNIVWTLTIDRDQSLWIGTEGQGLTLYRDAIFSVYKEHDGLTSNLVSHIFVDREGCVWVATKGGGINQFFNGFVTTYTIKEGLPYDYIYCVYGDRDDTLWLGTGNAGLGQFRDGKFSNYTTKDGLATNIILSIYGSRRGGVWLGTDGGGLQYWDNGIVLTVTPEVGLSSGNIWSILEDSQGAVWIGTDGSGLNRYVDGVVTNFDFEWGFTSEYISEITEGLDGSTWIATRDVGLYRFKDDIFENFSTENGLLSNIVWTIYEDTDSLVWIGTSNGLNCLRDSHLSSLTTADGLFEDVIYCIIEDNYNCLWMSGNGGIYCIEKAAIERYDRGEIKKISYLSLGISDGMKTTECSYGSPSGWKTSDGHLWFPTIRGLVTIDPSQIYEDLQIPLVKIENISFNDNDRNPGDDLIIPPGPGNVEIKYTVLSFRDPQKVRFRYWLHGFDSDWTEAGNRRAAYYTNLKPGHYTFHVSARNPAGDWNDTSTIIEFELRPHFYQTIFFYLIIGIIVIGGFFGSYRLRVIQMRRREIYLQKRIQDAVAEIKTLGGLIPICASCKKIRDDKGYWNQVEKYISEHTNAVFSHGMCPECMQKYYGNYIGKKTGEDNRDNQSG